jgi:hypothetical protein
MKKIIFLICFAVTTWMAGGCDTNRTDAPPETIVAGDTANVPPPPPPPTGTLPLSDRGAGSEPGTGVVETGTFQGAPERKDTIRTSTVDPVIR